MNPGVERLNSHLKDAYLLNPDEQQAIIESYSPEIAGLKSRQRYITQESSMTDQIDLTRSVKIHQGISWVGAHLLLRHRRPEFLR